jgi:uncharacterized protein (TIGR02246 family)
MRPLIPALAIALAAAPGLAGPREDVAAAAPVIDAVNADWIPAMRAKDAARVGAAYASDAVNISSAGQVIEGHDAFVARLRKQFDAGMTVSGGSIRRQGLEPLSPGLLLEWGEAGFDARMADGREVKAMGPYVTVWRRAADGRWSIIRNQSF